MRDPKVSWLRESLAAIQDRHIQLMDSDQHDQNLETRVKDYQGSHHLDGDGLAGQHTQIMINSDLGTSSISKLGAAN